MKKLALVLILLGAALVVWLLLARPPQPAPKAVPKSQTAQDAAVANAFRNASSAAQAAIENSFAGATAQAGQESPDIKPSAEDKLTGEILGKRVAEYAVKLKK